MILSLRLKDTIGLFFIIKTPLSDILSVSYLSPIYLIIYDSSIFEIFHKIAISVLGSVYIDGTSVAYHRSRSVRTDKCIEKQREQKPFTLNR